MLKIATFMDKVVKKIQLEYRKRLFAEKTGQDVSTAHFMGKVEVRNKNIVIGKDVYFRGDVILDGDGSIVIGNEVRINHGTIIYASKKGGITIGDHTQIAAQSYIIDMDHGIEKDMLIRNQENTAAPICIGSDVWIAAGCKVLKGSVIHDGAVIGAGSVVKGDIPENAIAVGSPARVKKYRGEK